ncbi:apolipoprotein N-acyltransferase [Thermosulfuriphilus sp.]
MSGLILSLASAGLLLLAYPKPNLYQTAWLALVPFFWLSERSVREAGRYGFFTGFFFFLGLLYWLIHVLNYYGFIPLIGAISMVALLALYLGAYFALVAMGASYLLKHLSGWWTVAFPPLAAFIFVGCEYLREIAFSGFPWGSLWASQVRWPEILAIARLAGPWTISFVVVSFNASVYLCLRHRELPSLFSLALAGLMVVLAFWYGSEKLHHPLNFSGLKVGIIQGNISQDQKWDPAFQEETLKIYEALSQRAVAQGARLIIWPETATPFVFHPEEGPGKEVIDLAKRLKVYLLFGAPVARFEGTKLLYHNSAFLISPQGRIIGRYDKQHLVPFGEYVPGEGKIPLLRKLVGSAGDYSPGPMDGPLFWKDSGLGVLICFEAIFPKISRNLVLKGAKVLINLTNDAWFGRSAGPWQHFDLAQVRAAETGIALVRVANTGISGLIGPYGRPLVKGPLEAPWYQVVDLPQPEKSLYLVIGPLVPYLSLAISLVVLLAMVKEALSRRRKT